MLRLIVAFLIAAPWAAAHAADNAPKLNIEKVCHDIAKVGGTSTDFDACMRSENDWHAVLVQEWPQFPASDRRSCLSLSNTGGVGSTYSELLTCLELYRDVRKAHPGETDAGLEMGTGTVGLGTR